MNGLISANPFVTTLEDGTHRLNMLIEGMHCPSCVAIIEGALHKQQGIVSARLNLSTKRLCVVWQGEVDMASQWIGLINGMGYRAVAFDEKTSQTLEKKEEQTLLRALAVAGFASGNLMLFSVPMWTSDAVEMGDATRTMFEWVQVLIALPAIMYCGLPFYRSAWRALKGYHTNMDVPISVAVLLTATMSLFETIRHGQHTYFDSAVMLLFFLLIGRYLESRARGRARGAAQHLLQMMTGMATRLRDDGTQEIIELSHIKEGMILLVAAGEKIGADGRVIQGESDIDTSLITGETMPRSVGIGGDVFAGTINQSAPIQVRVTKAGERSLIAEIVKLMEVAEQSQAKYVTLADRISGWYTPVVHGLAVVTFLGWVFLGGAAWQVGLLYAATVLIITCPCALGLAVPVVQVLASSKLMKLGILLKSGSALERLTNITHAVFDKTGTLTLGKPELLQPEQYTADQMQLAASLAIHSRHPLSQALARAYSGTLLSIEVQEIAGSGLQTQHHNQAIRLGKRSWCTSEAQTIRDEALELWLAIEGGDAIRFTFSDRLRDDAKEVIRILSQNNIKLLLLSGDRLEVVTHMAQQVGITEALATLSPLEKTAKINELKQQGAHILMVGDGLNDAPSLASASVSMSPTSAMDITQNAADIVFQGELLMPVVTSWHVAKFSQMLVKQNFILAILYNIIAIPLAVAGYVTPVIAAVAMSSSSLLVIANAMRLNWLKDKPL